MRGDSHSLIPWLSQIFNRSEFNRNGVNVSVQALKALMPFKTHREHLPVQITNQIEGGLSFLSGQLINRSDHEQFRLM